MTLELRNVSKRYPTGAVGASGVDLVVAAGEFVALFGPSGSGKTTMLHLMGLLLDPDEGEVHIDGKRVDGIGEAAAAELRRTRLGFVFQNFGLLPLLSAEENVEIALRLLHRTRRSRQRVADALAVVGLEGRRRHRPDELSGGEQQRVALARALVHAPGYLLGDEPTGALDTTTGTDILELLGAVARGGPAVVIATHDPNALEVVDTAYFVRDGRLHRPSRDELAVWLTEGKAGGDMTER